MQWCHILNPFNEDVQTLNCSSSILPLEMSLHGRYCTQTKMTEVIYLVKQSDISGSNMIE